MEQYKLYLELTDRITGRRDVANAFFLTLHTTCAAGVGFLLEKLDRLFAAWTLAAILVPLIALCIAWWLKIRGYRQLNAGRYQVIHDLEGRLPANIHSYEWLLLGSGRDWKKYLQLTWVEKLTPIIFAALYVALAIAVWTKPDEANAKADGSGHPRAAMNQPAIPTATVTTRRVQN